MYDINMIVHVYTHIIYHHFQKVMLAPFCNLKNISLLWSLPFASHLESHPISLALIMAPLSMTGKELRALCHVAVTW